MKKQVRLSAIEQVVFQRGHAIVYGKTWQKVKRKNGKKGKAREVRVQVRVSRTAGCEALSAIEQAFNLVAVPAHV